MIVSEVNERMRILIAEDDRDLNKVIEKKLSAEGYAVDACYDGETALEYLDAAEYDAAVLDIMMPKMDGLQVVRKMRQQNNMTPVIFLTARDTVADKVKGLDMGANDYVTKPFSMKILLKKISVILSREQRNLNVFDDGFIKIDFELGTVKKEDDECALTPTEYRILKKLIEHKGQLLTYSLLLDSLWDEGIQLMDKHTLAVNINRLRKKIETKEHTYISNVYGMGYIWK